MIQPTSATHRRAARRAGRDRRRARGRRRVRQDPAAGRARGAAARLHQRARVAAAEVSRRGAGAVGGDPRRGRDRRRRSCSSTRAWTPGRCCSSARSRSIPSETSGELLDAARADSAPRALLEALAAIARRHRARRDAQDHARGDARARCSTKADGAIDFAQPAAIGRRADPRRRSVAGRAGDAARADREAVPRARRTRGAGPSAPGTVLAIDARRRCTSRAATASSSIRELQAPGRKRLPPRSSPPAAASRSATC